MNDVRLVCALSLLLGCAPGASGTDSGNAATAGLLVTGEGQALTAARETGPVSAAWMTVGELEFKSCGDEEDDELDFEGPFEVDLRTGLDLGTTELGFDRVCELELGIGDEDGPGVAVEVSGLTAGGVPYSLVSERDFEVEVESDIALDEATTRLDLLFDVDAWFAGIDLDSGTLTDGELLLDGDNNSALLQAVESRIETSARLALEGP